MQIAGGKFNRLFTHTPQNLDMSQIVFFPSPSVINLDTRRRSLAEIFSDQAIEKQGIVRQSARDVDQRIGRDALIDEVRKRGFHLVETGGQYLIICDRAPVSVLC